MISSRLLVYEVWTRIHARKLTRTHSEPVQFLLGKIALVELATPVLARALEPFPLPVRTLDALHLASMQFLKEQGQKLELASYDERLVAAARRLRFRIAPL
ncbi:MAG: hypothetical protein ACE5HU_01490 [Acidobacteriota bacterium]